MGNRFAACPVYLCVVTRALFLTVLVLVALPACSSDSTGEVPVVIQVTIQSVQGLPDSAELLLVINTCQQGPQASVEETPTAVRVTVTADRSHDNQDCADGITVNLAGPLGDRNVFDVVAGSNVDVQPLRR